MQTGGNNALEQWFGDKEKRMEASYVLEAESTGPADRLGARNKGNMGGGTMIPMIRTKNNRYQILSIVPSTYRCSKMGVSPIMSTEGIRNESE